MAQSRGKAQAEETVTADIVQSTAFSEEALRSVESLADVMALVEKQFGSVADADQDMGDGFKLVKDLIRFQDVPCVLMEWTFRDGDFGTYVSIRFAAQTDTGLFKGIYNDGSTGICKQLQDYTARTNRTGGLIIRSGFRVSEYDYTDDKGNSRPAKTWYLNV